MAARRFWPATKVGWLNSGLCIVLVLSGVKYHKELQWAWVQIHDYRQGRIDSPLEREIYLEGKRQLYQAKRPEAAIPLLNESIRIDPNTDAQFLLAESYRAKGELELAAQQYERSLKMDYLNIRARLALIETYRRLGRRDRARQTAAAGAQVFDNLVREYEPRLDRTVAKRFNSKARQVYNRYVKAWKTFRNLTQQFS